jgi:dihydrofolate reductase
MSKLTVTEFVSLDGVIEAPGGEPGYPHSGWVFDYMTSEQQAYKLRETLEAPALLLGRKTYDGFSAAWPERDGEFADKMNSMPKYVVSSSLSDPTWENTTVVALDDVPDLKASTDLLVAGSGSLVHQLLERGWIDELRMMIFPVVLGSGLRLFPSSPDKHPLKLTHTEAFPTGVVVHHYEGA